MRSLVAALLPVVANGKPYVSLAAEGESAIRLSVNCDGETPTRRDSQMLAPKEKTAECELDVYGTSLSCPFGHAAVHDNSLELHDADGNLLIKSAELAVCDGDFLQVRLDKPIKGAKSVFYGAGSKAGAPIEHDHSQPWVVNNYGEGAEAWAPQYYSLTDKYAALAVSSHDHSNRTDYWSGGVPDWGKYPANWTSSPEGVTWMTDGTQLDVYLMPASDTYAYLRAHSDLTGKPKVPPRYAFGFLASRWGWTDREYLEHTLQQFRHGKFPMDAFISDFEFFGTFNDYDVPETGNSSYHDFSWNEQLFPHPSTQLQIYKDLGIRMGAIRKPRFGNPEYINDLRQNGWLMPNYLNQELYLAGPGRHINFSTPEAKQWYADHNQHYLEEGIDFWWNDEGEVYYFQFHDWNAAQEMGLKEFDETKRFFSLNRVFTPGLQRFGAAVWTGDIPTSWEAFAQQPGYLINNNLAGNVYLGCDTGGFAGGQNVSSELLARWYWSSAFFSIMRVHSSCTTNGHNCVLDDETLPTVPHFPFLYGEEAGVAMRKALEMRYRLIPMMYSLGHGAFIDGAPITRPLLMEFGADEIAAKITDQWLVGSGLMTAPVFTEGGSRSIYFPTLSGDQSWFELDSTKTRAGGVSEDVTVALDSSPVFCRSGTLLPLGPIVQHTGELPGPDAILEMHVYSGSDGMFTLVEDDGESRAYETGDVRRTTFTWEEASQTLSWTVSDGTHHSSMFRRMIIKLFKSGAEEAVGSPAQALGVDGSFAFSSKAFLI